MKDLSQSIRRDNSFHRRGAEKAETTQRKSLRKLGALCVSAVKKPLTVFV
jgi:hypothetical protein